MPGRKNEPASGYRYGFNGKEKDKDMNSLTAYDYGFRIYNPAIGRFLSVDPLANEYPWNSTYAFAENDPINFIDLDGLEKAKQKITLTAPVIVAITREEVYNLVLNNTAHTTYRDNVSKGYTTIGAREYSYIASYESLTLTMFDRDGDPNGNASIGFGHLIHTGPIGNTPGNVKLEEPYKNGITQEQAVEIFIKDVQGVEAEVNKAIEDIKLQSSQFTGRQFTALLDIRYNLPRRLFKKLLQIFKDEGAAAAAIQIRKWAPTNGGLKYRREFEARLLENKDFLTLAELQAEAAEARKKAAAEKKAAQKAAAEKKKAPAKKPEKKKT